GIGLIDREIRPDGLAGIVVDGSLDRVEPEGSKDHFGAAPLQNLARPEQLPLLETVGRDDQYAGFGDQRHRQSPSLRHRNSPARRSSMPLDESSKTSWPRKCFDI